LRQERNRYEQEIIDKHNEGIERKREIIPLFDTMMSLQEEEVQKNKKRWEGIDWKTVLLIF
jgi:hypothetical protein